MFYCNNGYQAGGITAIGFSIMQYEDNVLFNFTCNTGTIVGNGGAIYASSYDPHVFDSSQFYFKQSRKGNASNVTFYLQKMVPSQQYLSLDCNHVDMCVLKMMLKVHGFVTNLVMVLM